MKDGKFFNSKISKSQSRDSGMAVVLISLIISVFTKNLIFTKLGILFLIITMAIPIFFKYFAFLWLGFSHIIGTFVSRIILTVVFVLVVTPLGLIRRLMGYDTLKLKEFKKGNESVMEVGDHLFKSTDIEKPY